MYGRKVQLVKKKKTGLSTPAKSSGSNWGPRIALYEREQKRQQLENPQDYVTASSQRSLSSGTGNYCPQFRNPCALSENGNLPFYPGIGKYLRNGYGNRNSNNGPTALKVQIPPPIQFQYETTPQGVILSGTRGENDSLPSTETWRSSDQENDSRSNSMTRTTMVPTEDDEDGYEDERAAGDEVIQVAPSQYELLCKCDTPPPRKPCRKSSSPDIRKTPEVYTAGNTKRASYSSGTSSSGMRAGFTMVYVPMESSVSRRPKLSPPESPENVQLMRVRQRSPPAKFENVGKPPMTVSTPTSASSRSKDPDNDSLLESFDSVIFKPKLSPPFKNKGKAPNPNPSIPTPPPLPPKNKSPPPLPPSNGGKKSLRFADNLESGNLESSKFEKNNANHHSHSNGLHSEVAANYVKVKQGCEQSNNCNIKVQTTFTASNNGGDGHNDGKQKHGEISASAQEKSSSNFDNNNAKDDNDDDGYTGYDEGEEDANFSSYRTCRTEAQLLSVNCGHGRGFGSAHAQGQDNYSTLSSVQSHSQLPTPGGSPKVSSDKSALQQLRDLSILIGGSFHSPEDEQTALLENELKSRKSSDAVSADSGKGSANDLASSNSAEGNSNCGCAETTCLFRPDCEECQMFFKNPFEKTPTLSNSKTPNAQEEEDEYSGGSRSRKKSSGGTTSSKSSKKQGGLKFLKNPGKTGSKSKPVLILPENLTCGCGDNSNLSKYGREIYKPLTKTQLLLRKSEDLRNSQSRKSRHHQTINNRHQQPSKRSPGINSNSSSGNSIDPTLFTIDEEASQTAAEEMNNNTSSTADIQRRSSNNRNKHSLAGRQEDDNGLGKEEHQEQHFHPKCWLSPDATMGWSDLESLYSQNLKREQPITVNGECWTCWQEMSQFKYNNPESNRTVDRTKRMFIWLNKRPKEFNAPWWEAKKQASIKWLTCKAYAHMPKSLITHEPFKVSKRDKTKYRMRDEITVGLANGKLYCMALDNLYQKNREKRSQGLSHWEIIKILSRRGVYVAQPSDMKLTEGTLRQKKPLRIAAHIALIEAIMGLYAKELVTRERVAPILKSFGQELDPELDTPEQLIISWVNAAILTMKSYILTNNNGGKALKLSSAQVAAWLRVPPMSEIRDLSDGIGLCCLLALYFTDELNLEEIGVGSGSDDEDSTLSIYEMILNHSLVQKLCQSIFPERLFHLCVTDFLYIHGYMKQNILSFLIDLFYHLEINPVVRVNRLTHVPLRVQL